MHILHHTTRYIELSHFSVISAAVTTTSRFTASRSGGCATHLCLGRRRSTAGDLGGRTYLDQDSPSYPEVQVYRLQRDQTAPTKCCTPFFQQGQPSSNHSSPTRAGHRKVRGSTRHLTGLRSAHNAVTSTIFIPSDSIKVDR